MDAVTCPSCGRKWFNVFCDGADMCTACMGNPSRPWISNPTLMARYSQINREESPALDRYVTEDSHHG